MKRILQTVMLSALFVLPLVALPAMARGQEDEVTEVTTTREEKMAERKARIEGRLSEIRLQVCEKRLATIERIMNRSATQGTKHLGVFDKVLDRVKDFYETKELSVANYDELVETTEGARESAMEAIDAVNDELAFECSGDNPVGKIDKFNHRVRNMHKELKDYRTTIKNLIVGIMGAAKQSDEGGDE